jgi:response regulator RpfG family c-di-GMP phosphodiesterase
METSYVVERIKHFAGARYDPIVVEAFVRAYEKGTLAPIPLRPALEEQEAPSLAEAL